MNTDMNNVTKQGLTKKIKGSAKRVRSLLNMQIGDKLRRRTKEENNRFIFRLFLKILAVLLITAALTAVCMLLQSMFYVPMGRNMLASILLITQLVTVVSDLGAIQRVLFSDKENSLLITFPCNFSDIILSKLILFFLKEMKKNCFFLLPFLIGFAIATGQGVIFYLSVPFVFVILSAVPIFINCVLSVIFVYGKRVIYSNPLLCVISTLTLFGSIFAVVYKVLLLLPNPLKFLQEYSKYIGKISGVTDKMAKYSFNYGSISDILVGEGTFADAVIVLGSFIVIMAIGLLVIVPFYFKFLNNISERSGNHNESKKQSKKRYAINNKKRKSLYGIFLKKELIETFRDSHKLSNIVASFLILPMISYIMNYILDAINTNPMGEYMVIAFNLMVSASLLAAFNTECAYALSSEGLEFAVLKSSPNNTAAIVWGKITITLISNLIAIGVTVVMLYFTVGIKVTDLILFVVTLFLLAAGMILWSFQLDVRRPLFSEYASKGSSGVVDNPNVGLATLIGFIVATIAGAFTLLMLYDDYITGWIRIVAAAAAFCIARIYLFYRNLHVYFREIEL